MDLLKRSYLLLSVLLASCLGFSFIGATHAKERIRWTPNSDRGSVNSTLSGGRRGASPVSCNIGDETTQLALMVPDDQSRLLTTTANPTLAWHITTATPVSMTLHVSDPEAATPVYSQTMTLEKTALIRATIPQEHSLNTRKRYRWTVFVTCPGEHETEISARSFVEHVNRESLDMNNLPPLEQARSYANQGIWYDAIDALLMARSQGSSDAETMMQTLLEQGQSPAEITLSAVVHL